MEVLLRRSQHTRPFSVSNITVQEYSCSGFSTISASLSFLKPTAFEKKKRVDRIDKKIIYFTNILGNMSHFSNTINSFEKEGKPANISPTKSDRYRNCNLCQVSNYLSSYTTLHHPVTHYPFYVNSPNNQTFPYQILSNPLTIPIL